MRDSIIGHCQHCNAPIFDRANDPRLNAMAHLCWKCVKPHGISK